MNVMLESLTAAAPHEYSALHAAFMLAMAGGLDQLFTPELSLAERFEGGSHAICEQLAKRLEGQIRLLTPVKSCVHAVHQVQVSTPQGDFSARHLVLAVPPVLANQIQWSPPLPTKRRALQHHLPQGAVIKFLAIYDEPFWRKQGLSGWVNSVEGPCYDVLDNSPKDAHVGVLTTFVVADYARQMAELERSERQSMVLKRFADFYGDQALHPNEFFELDWNAEAYSAGGYQGNFVLGGWTDYGSALRDPIGSIHLAGSETSSVMYGHMEGAVRSGERVALEIQQQLQLELT
jgi:monoamine oxidase